MRVVVVGGCGNFGRRIVAALRADPSIEILVAGRSRARSFGATDASHVVLDIDAPDLDFRIRKLAPELVVHCVGPFQGQDYRVARATLAANAHYLDLADGRQFVADFTGEMNDQATSVGKIAISGASTLPALSSAVVDDLSKGLSSLASIEVVIAPGQLAPRGKATIKAVFSYLGRPFLVWRRGRWKHAWGWMDLRRTRLDIGDRLGAACDVPDLALFPDRYRGVQTVTFHAALEFAAQHLALWGIAALRRIGLPLPVTRWAEHFDRIAGMFDALAGNNGGMSVSVVGIRSDGRCVRRTWQLSAPALAGPEIPCMAAVLLARRIASGGEFRSGATPCIGLMSLQDFAPEFARWDITTRTEELPA